MLVLRKKSYNWIHLYVSAYDLATQCPSRKSMRRHTVVCTISNAHGSVSVPQSRPVSRNTSTPPAEDSLSYTLPGMSWSRSSLQEELFESVIPHFSSSLSVQ